MRKKISEMTLEDKSEFLKHTKEAILREQGIPWDHIESTIIEDIENTFDDEKFAKMDPAFQIDAASARKELRYKKPELVDYMLWSLQFVTKSEYVEW